MEEPDDNSDFDDLFLPFALSRALHKQGIQSSGNQIGFETSGEYVDIVLDDDNSSEAGDVRSDKDLGLLDEGGDPSSLCPSPSPLSSLNPSDSQPDLSDLRRANSSCQRANILDKLDSFDSVETDQDGGELRDRKDSILDGLLCEIYDRCHASTRPSVDSDGFTECSSDGAYLSSKGDSFQESSRLPRTLLNVKCEDPFSPFMHLRITL